MPMRIDSARRLTDLARNQRQLLFRKSEDINLDVENIVRADFSGNSPRHDVQILKALEDAGDCARISVGNDSKSQ